jgi:hypothetical protein
MCELIAEVDDVACLRYGREGLGRHARQTVDGLANDDELPLDCRADQPVRQVALKVDASECLGDGIA